MTEGAVHTPAEEDAGRVEGGVDGGQETQDADGGQSPEDVVAALEAEKARAQGLSDEVEQLRQLKGRMGNELGSVRMQMAKQQGMLEALQTAKTESAEAGISTTSIYEQLGNGDIDEVQALQAMEKALSTKYEGQLNKVRSEVQTIQQTAENEKYVANFLAKNPGYKEAYDSGALNKWLYQGVPGETAWTEYRAEQASNKVAELEKKIAEAKAAGERAGLQKGTQLQHGKSGAAKVLGEQAAGGRVQVTPPTGISKSERARAGYEYIQKLRAAR